MQRTIKHTKRTSTLTRPVWQIALIGLGISGIITLIGILLVATLFYTGTLSGTAGQYQLAAYSIIILSLVSGMLFVWKKTSGMDRFWVLGVPISYFVIRLILGAILTFL